MLRPDTRWDLLSKYWLYISCAFANFPLLNEQGKNGVFTIVHKIRPVNDKYVFFFLVLNNLILIVETLVQKPL